MSNKQTDEYLESMKEIYKDSIALGNRKCAREVLSSLNTKGYAEEASQLMVGTRLDCLIEPAEWPTQEEINGGFTGINNGNNGQRN